MNTPRQFSRSLVAVVLAAGMLGTAVAGSDAPPRTWLYGKATTPEAGATVVDVNTARHLNIKCGDVITFRNGDKTFAWKFDVVGHRTVALQAIAPAGFSQRDFSIYVDPNEYERSGG